jgi:hypothetical protein
MKLAILITSILLNIWFASTIIQLERFHYSVQVGACGNFKDELERTKWLSCNETSETRTHSFWHLFYALKK